MNIKKSIATFAVASLAVAGLAACGGNNASSEDTDLTYPEIELGTTGTDLETTITFYNGRTDMGTDTYKGKNWADYIAEFNKLYPGIKVDVQTDSNYASNALTRLQGGDWGDIMMIPAVDQSELPTYFLPLGDLKDMEKEVKLADEKAYDGKVYGVATDGQTSGVIYNKRIFEEAGITELPKTPDEFIADLKLIKEKTDAIPLYTNYAAGFTMGAWDAYIGGTATGDDAYMNQELPHTRSPFSDPGDGTHAYNVYKILYDAVDQGLTEDDYSTTDWETSKTLMNDGDVATMVLGAWAVTQMQQIGEHGDDVGYMPFPISVDGKQYASLGGNYSMGVNIDSSADRQEASMIFIKWLTEQSGYAMNEGGVPIAADDENLPSIYADFGDVEMIPNLPAKEGEEDLLNDINSESELGINSNGDKKVQGIVEHAANHDMSFDDIMDEWNTSWNDALDTLGVEAK